MWRRNAIKKKCQNAQRKGWIRLGCTGRESKKEEEEECPCGWRGAKGWGRGDRDLSEQEMSKGRVKRCSCWFRVTFFTALATSQPTTPSTVAPGNCQVSYDRMEGRMNADKSEWRVLDDSRFFYCCAKVYVSLWTTEEKNRVQTKSRDYGPKEGRMKTDESEWRMFEKVLDLLLLLHQSLFPYGRQKEWKIESIDEEIVKSMDTLNYKCHKSKTDSTLPTINDTWFSPIL